MDHQHYAHISNVKYEHDVCDICKLTHIHFVQKTVCNRVEDEDGGTFADYADSVDLPFCEDCVLLALEYKSDDLVVVS